MNQHLLGIDLGTSSVKVVVIDTSGQVLGVGMHPVPTHTPAPGLAEQLPHDWWVATSVAVRAALHQAGPTQIAGIGFSGQMHGTVLLDASAAPLGPAIIWADQRSASELSEMMALVGREQLARLAGTAPAAGFMGATLRWLLRHDPARLERAAACVLPKDYLRLRLTGEIATDASDASGTALFDIRQRRWASPIIEALGLPARLLSPVLESAAVAGQLLATAAAELGLPAGIPVVAGCADQPAQAIGNGLITPGVGSLTVGTGGQVFVPLAEPRIDQHLRLHSFCHAPPEGWYTLGAMLAAGLSLRWLRDTLGMANQPDAYERLAAEAASVPPGSDGLLFLPYLVGERAPVMDPYARGAFAGLSLQHTRGHLARAIMEGVAYALRQILATMAELDAAPAILVVAGNGMASPLWRQIVADVLGRPLAQTSGPERSGVGAALVAGIGSGIYQGYADACALAGAPQMLCEPDSQVASHYAAGYQRFCMLYPQLKPLTTPAA